jgi:undecaprenyl-diphosphatase
MDLLFQAFVIGALQGLAEFLPISSSAHLILAPELLGWTDPFLNSATFDVMLHGGTLVALLVYFWRDVLRLVAAGWAALRERSLAGDPDRRLAGLLLVSVVPAALLGALFESFFDDYFRADANLWLIPLIMVVGAIVLWVAERIGRLDRELDRLHLGDALAIGIAQAFALFPGTSRSGVTIAMGLFRGLTRESSARFAFLMGIPIIAGATLWKMRTLVTAPQPSDQLGVLIVGTLSATLFGLLAISFLLRYLRTHDLGIFIAYRLVFAAIVTAVLLTR